MLAGRTSVEWAASPVGVVRNGASGSHFGRVGREPRRSGTNGASGSYVGRVGCEPRRRGTTVRAGRTSVGWAASPVGVVRTVRAGRTSVGWAASPVGVVLTSEQIAPSASTMHAYMQATSGARGTSDTRDMVGIRDHSRYERDTHRGGVQRSPVGAPNEFKKKTR